MEVKIEYIESLKEEEEEINKDEIDVGVILQVDEEQETSIIEVDDDFKEEEESDLGKPDVTGDVISASFNPWVTKADPRVV